jgi:drug/metabolite transporter (DMT)-like permease
MEKTQKSYIYAILAIFFWSTVPTVFKICLKDLGILPMLTIASLVSAIVLFIVLAAGRKTGLIRKLTPGDLFHSALLGLLNPVIYYLLLLKAYQLLPAQVAQPSNMVWPIILVFLSIPILGQKIKSKSFIALFISFAGVYIISSQGHLFSPGHADIKGVLLAVASSFFWALYFILNMKDLRDEALKLFLNFLFGTIYLVIALLITGKLQVSVLTFRGVAAAVYVGIFEMGITFFFWLKALQLAESTDKVSNLVYIAPFLSLIFLHYIIHEPVYYTTPVGLLLIISGILIQNYRPAGR